MRRLNFLSKNYESFFDISNSLRDKPENALKNLIKISDRKNIFKIRGILQILSLIFFLGTQNIAESKIIYGKNMLENQDTRLDINRVTKEEMLKDGIASGYITKILDYRSVTGGFENLDELKRIGGIGEATYQKLIKKFKVESSFEKRRLKINSADDTALKYYGFTKDEIKKIRKYHEVKGKFDNNIPLMELLTQKRYEKYRDLFEY